MSTGRPSKKHTSSLQHTSLTTTGTSPLFNFTAFSAMACLNPTSATSAPSLVCGVWVPVGESVVRPSPGSRCVTRLQVSQRHASPSCGLPHASFGRAAVDILAALGGDCPPHVIHSLRVESPRCGGDTGQTRERASPSQGRLHIHACTRSHAPWQSPVPPTPGT